MTSRKKSAAAKKGWATRRARAAQDAADLAYLIAGVERQARLAEKKRKAAAAKGVRTKARQRRERERGRREPVKDPVRVAAGKQAAATRKRRQTEGVSLGDVVRVDDDGLIDDGPWDVEVGIDYEPVKK